MTSITHSGIIPSSSLELLRKIFISGFFLMVSVSSEAICALRIVVFMHAPFSYLLFAQENKNTGSKTPFLSIYSTTTPLQTSTKQGNTCTVKRTSALLERTMANHALHFCMESSGAAALKSQLCMDVPAFPPLQSYLIVQICGSIGAAYLYAGVKS